MTRSTRPQAMALARQSGVPVRIIAAHFRVSRQAVYRACRRRGISEPIGLYGDLPSESNGAGRFSVHRDQSTGVADLSTNPADVTISHFDIRTTYCDTVETQL